MSMNDQQACQILNQDIQALLEQRRGLRQKERNLKIRKQALLNEFTAGGPESTAKGLAGALRHILPYYLYPANVGQLEKVYWPFDYTFDFNFGTDPTLTSGTRQEQTVRVSQEAAAIITSITYVGKDQSEAGFRGPYQVNLIDNQSSRQLNESPIPVQALGRRSNPTHFGTGYIVMPNASMSLVVDTWLPDGESMPTVGDGLFSIIVSGIRIRVDDFRQVLSTTF